ncbi:MAG TPA: hypothetical protein VF624_13865 [Tepidisphaeraceae bacterium]|jgi:predicted transcriptional regulator
MANAHDRDEQERREELADLNDAVAGVTYPVTVNLSPFAKRVLDKLVNEDGYRTVEAAIDDAIQRTQETDEWRQGLRERIEHGLAQSKAGETVDGPTFMKQMREKILAYGEAEKRAKSESKREAV